MVLVWVHGRHIHGKAGRLSCGQCLVPIKSSSGEEKPQRDMASHKATRLVLYKRRDMWFWAGSMAGPYMAKLTHSTKTRPCNVGKRSDDGLKTIPCKRRRWHVLEQRKLVKATRSQRFLVYLDSSPEVPKLFKSNSLT